MEECLLGAKGTSALLLGGASSPRNLNSQYTGQGGHPKAGLVALPQSSKMCLEVVKVFAKLWEACNPGR